MAESFTRRVDRAARMIAAGDRPTREFDRCFEMHDGDMVAAALIRRAEADRRLAGNLFRYIDPDRATAAHARLAGVDLAVAARQCRRAATHPNPSEA